jgi:hypothetical protein
MDQVYKFIVNLLLIFLLFILKPLNYFAIKADNNLFRISYYKYSEA